LTSYDNSIYIDSKYGTLTIVLTFRYILGSFMDALILPSGRIWSLMQTKSRRAFIKTQDRRGRRYNYVPRDDFVTRIAMCLNISKEQARREINQMREDFLIKNGLFTLN
jgi:hypothetical protein